MDYDIKKIEMNKKTDDTIIKRLYSDNLTQINLALDAISEHGNSAYISMLIDVLNQSADEMVQERILKILSEIKHSDAVPELIKAIENEKYLSIQESLLRVCWENGLDFSNYFETLINIVINGAYMNAFEAFTIIENNDGIISSTSAQEHLNKLNEALENASTDRAVLINHVIDYLPHITSK